MTRQSPDSQPLGNDWYYEDIEVGTAIVTPTHTVSMADIQAFAEITRDRHPLHTDEAHCRNTAFGKIIAHGMYGVALIEGLKSELGHFGNSSIASLGWDDIAFKAPIFVDDTLHAVIEFESKRESRSGPNGIVIERIVLRNQRDEVVISARHIAMLKYRDG